MLKWSNSRHNAVKLNAANAEKYIANGATLMTKP